MTARVFRLTQLHQRIDERRRAEFGKLRPDWLEVLRPKKLKLGAKDVSHRLSNGRRKA